MSIIEREGAIQSDDEQVGSFTVPTSVEAEVEAELQRTIPPQFSVRDAETAAWVVRRVVAAREYKGRVKVWAEAEQRRAAREEERLMFVFGGQLREWAEAEIAKLQGRRKSLALPGGTVGFRAVGPRVVVRDEARVMEWARKCCPAAIVTSERLLKSPISEHVQTTGEVPQGVEVTSASEEFFVK
jgi:hypothetical protein